MTPLALYTERALDGIYANQMQILCLSIFQVYREEGFDTLNIDFVLCIAAMCFHTPGHKAAAL